MTTCSSSESFKNSPLNWFAAFISTTVDHLENDNETDFNDKVNGLKEFLSDEMDYFEFMTLNLTDKKDLDCCCKSIDQTELPLMMLDLDNNNFSGKIPSSLWNLSTLMEFSAANNHLEGNIPMELGACVSLTTLDLGNNQLNGSIPDKLVELSELQCLQQHAFREHSETTLAFDESNNFGFVWKLVSGSIPAELGDAVILQGVYLGHNQLSGTIPGSFGKLTGLVKLNLTGNVLFGSIPISFGNMKELTHSDLSYNMLSGELPSIMSGVQSLVGPYVQNNRLSGQVGEFFSNSMTWRIETMNLSHNCFDGNLSWSLGNLSYLTNLDLHQNQLTDEIPSDLGNLMQLEYFDVSDNTR
ncbi:leucine-rich repeat receptor protein kinase EMS1 [Lathyrus oleraceus]|uniref:leucine-rich repeat receptor protein kinase EMS1 n=1 Tax=Pisum sativum TaxID=3888 RepID=UPI0021D38609|nr:leucine-rich repeat receptor protein kinase EMS1-like [Pisum sativum]